MCEKSLLLCHVIFGEVANQVTLPSYYSDQNVTRRYLPWATSFCWPCRAKAKLCNSSYSNQTLLQDCKYGVWWLQDEDKFKDHSLWLTDIKLIFDILYYDATLASLKVNVLLPSRIWAQGYTKIVVTHIRQLLSAWCISIHRIFQFSPISGPKCQQLAWNGAP